MPMNAGHLESMIDLLREWSPAPAGRDGFPEPVLEAISKWLRAHGIPTSGCEMWQACP